MVVPIIEAYACIMWTESYVPVWPKKRGMCLFSFRSMSNIIYRVFKVYWAGLLVVWPTGNFSAWPARCRISSDRHRSPVIPLPRHLRLVVEPFLERRTLAFACWWDFFPFLTGWGLFETWIWSAFIWIWQLLSFSADSYSIAVFFQHDVFCLFPHSLCRLKIFAV